MPSGSPAPACSGHLVDLWTPTPTSPSRALLQRAAPVCFCKVPPDCENSGGGSYKLTFGKGTLLTVNPSKFEGTNQGGGEGNSKRLFLLI